MRFLPALATIALLLLPAGAHAQAGTTGGYPTGTSNAPASSSTPAPSHSFGSISCPQPISCSGLDISSHDMAAMASACITSYTGYPSADGFFDDYMGLDGNKCLTAKPNAIPKGMGAQLSPYCCITEIKPNSCIFRCEITTGH